MRKTNEENAITLIALVITIIVLLILTGVTIQSLTGEYGLLSKSYQAKNTNNSATEEEQIDIVVAESKMDREGSEIINIETLINKLDGLVHDNIITQYEPSTIESSTTVVEITGQTGTVYLMNLLTGEVAQKPILGTVVESYTSQDIEWKVFYVEQDANSEYFGDTYLIASDYVPVSKLPVSSASMTTQSDTSTYPYNICWSSAPTFQQITTTDAASGALSLSETLTLFKGTGYDISGHSGNSNSKAVSTLLNTSNWTSFVDSNYADYAIGGPTIEMWVASWNDTYSSDPLWCSGTGSYGYYFGTGTTTSSSSYNCDLCSYEGYQNTLYYRHTSGYSNCNAYWLASPSATKDSYVMHVNCSGNVGYNYSENGSLGLRPLVHLKSEVDLQYNGTTYILAN